MSVSLQVVSDRRTPVSFHAPTSLIHLQLPPGLPSHADPHTYRPAAGNVQDTMQPDCIAQSSKLSVCLWGARARPGRCGVGRSGASTLLSTTTPIPAGQGTHLLEIAAILGKRGGSGPQGSGGRDKASRGVSQLGSPGGSTGGRADARRTGARRPRRLGEGCARVPCFCLELSGVTRQLLPLSRVPSGLGGFGGEIGVRGKMALEGRDSPWSWRCVWGY